MSKLLAFRAPDHLAQAILELATQSGKSQTDVIIDALTIGLGLPATPLSPIEQRLLELEDRVLAIVELETQMLEVGNRLDAIDRDETNPIALPDPTQDSGLRPLELVEPVKSVAIDRIISPESSRDPSEAGISTRQVRIAPDDILTNLINQGHRAAAIARHLNKLDYTNTIGKPMTRESVNSRIGANSKIQLLYRHQD